VKGEGVEGRVPPRCIWLGSTPSPSLDSEGEAEHGTLKMKEPHQRARNK